MDIDISPDGLHQLVDNIYRDGVENHVNEVIDLALRLDGLRDFEYKIKAIQLCLGPMLDVLPYEELEIKIFSPVLLYSKGLFEEMLNNIENCLGGNANEEVAVRNITSLLKLCVTMMDCCDGLLVKMQQALLRNLEYVYSIPKNIASILHSSFGHCRKSETIYGDVLSAVSEVLTTLFHKSHEVQVNLFSFLETVKFSCSFDEDLKLLLEVMEVLEQCGEVLMNLGVKTLAQQWKGYTQLAGTYAEHLRPCLDVTKPLCFLANELTVRLQKTVSFTESNADGGKQLLKELKVGGFVLKILVKLSELYTECLGDCQTDMIRLLVTLHGLSRSYLSINNVPNEILDFVERSLTVGAGPLLTHLHQDRAFIEAFKNLNDGSSKQEPLTEHSALARADRIGSLLLCVAIMKKILNADRSVQQLWINSGISFIHVIFNLLDHSSVELTLDITVERVETTGNADLYETLLTQTTAYLLATVTEDSFGELEKLLLSKILQPKFWIALIASDILFLLSRFGNSDLRLEQVNYFVWQVANWPKDNKHRPEWIYLSNFTSRLLNILTPELAQSVLSQYPASVHGDLGFVSNDAVSQAEIDNTAQTLQSTLIAANLQGSDELNNVVRKLNSLPCIFTEECMRNYKCDELVCAVAKLWGICDITQAKYPDIGNWINDLIFALARASGVLLGFMGTYQISAVLQCLQKSSSRKSTLCKLGALEFLQNLASVEIKPSRMQMQVFDSVAELFSSMIQDSDPIVNANALETFEYFANVTRHARIISFTGQKSPIAQESIRCYLQRSFLSDCPDEVVNYDKYLERIDALEAKHKCDVRIPKQQIRSSLASADDRPKENPVSEFRLLSLVGKLNDTVQCVVNNYKVDSTNSKFRKDLEVVLEKVEICVRDCNKSLDE